MTGPDRDSPLDLAAAYALGALPAEEAARFEAFLATSPEARREVDEYREAAALLALAEPANLSAGSLRDRVLSRVHATPRSRPRRSAGAGLWVALAASMLAAVGLGLALLASRGRVTLLENELAARGRAETDVRRQLADRDAMLGAMLGPGVQLVQLTSSGDPEPGIQLFWNHEHQRALINGYRLRPVPPGRAYQLWFITDGKPVPSVTFKPSTDGRARVDSVAVPSGAVTAAAVTVEPEAGSPQPTSPIVLLGGLPKS
ncbi:MAG TPA: anti-sigma factor [Gemmatimonadales bacterium]